MKNTTHPLGPGTRNFPVNWPAHELEELARMASQRGQSLGHCIREWTRKGLAEEQRRRLTAGLLLALFMAATAASWLGWQPEQARRVRAQVRVVRTAKRGEWV